MSSPTSRTLQLLKQRGHTAGVVERWIPQARKRIDLMGCIDIVALVGHRIVGIQATSGSNVAARLTKAREEPRLKEWLKCGGRFIVIGWAKQGPRGKRKTWKHRCVGLELGGDGPYQYSVYDLD